MTIESSSSKFVSSGMHDLYRLQLQFACIIMKSATSGWCARDSLIFSRSLGATADAVLQFMTYFKLNVSALYVMNYRFV